MKRMFLLLILFFSCSSKAHEQYLLTEQVVNDFNLIFKTIKGILPVSLLAVKYALLDGYRQLPQPMVKNALIEATELLSYDSQSAIHNEHLQPLLSAIATHLNDVEQAEFRKHKNKTINSSLVIQESARVQNLSVAGQIVGTFATQCASTLTGVTGHSGLTGNNGNVPSQTENAGTTGQTGQTGNTGDIGTTGFTGPLGGVGALGQTGLTGPTGSTGFTGFTGSRGNQGAQGLTGNTGFAAGGLAFGYFYITNLAGIQNGATVPYSSIGISNNINRIFSPSTSFVTQFVNAGVYEITYSVAGNTLSNSPAIQMTAVDTNGNPIEGGTYGHAIAAQGVLAKRMLTGQLIYVANAGDIFRIINTCGDLFLADNGFDGSGANASGGLYIRQIA